ncbi:MAG: chorismate mutase, partial [Pseudomonadota bacterium]
MSKDKRLGSIRDRIDAVDEQLLALISERADLAQQVAEVKVADTDAAQFYRPDREAMVLRRVKEANPGPLDGEEVARIFREIMSA